ncbi:MAG: hypothetical protein DME32_15260 [Verrucomicrobia bacterium]|nr:MAG: hypothetical protein DME32_15260 [Verrucomicrobiota bacterium]
MATGLGLCSRLDWPAQAKRGGIVLVCGRTAPGSARVSRVWFWRPAETIFSYNENHTVTAKG